MPKIRKSHPPSLKAQGGHGGHQGTQDGGPDRADVRHRLKTSAHGSILPIRGSPSNSSANCWECRARFTIISRSRESVENLRLIRQLDQLYMKSPFFGSRKRAAEIVNPNGLQVSVGDLPATVQFAGKVGSGLYQVNVVIPENLPDGDHLLVARIGGQSTQTIAALGAVYVTVKRSD
jgi:hypothetical protein